MACGRSRKLSIKRNKSPSQKKGTKMPRKNIWMNPPLERLLADLKSTGNAPNFSRRLGEIVADYYERQDNFVSPETITPSCKESKKPDSSQDGAL